jgi:hypothetical protein
VDHVDEVVATKGLAEPVLERDLHLIASRFERLEGWLEVFGSDEEVKILGVALDARVASECVGAADENFNTRGPQDRERAGVEGPRLGVEDPLYVVPRRHRAL